MNRLEELKQLVESFEEDYTKFQEKGNKTAGTRARKSMQNIKTVAQTVRQEIQEIKNAAKESDHKVELSDERARVSVRFSKLQVQALLNISRF